MPILELPPNKFPALVMDYMREDLRSTEALEAFVLKVVKEASTWPDLDWSKIRTNVDRYQRNSPDYGL